MLTDPVVLVQTANLYERFREASPFPHVVIDDFFDPAFARRLLEEFPKHDGPFEGKVQHGDLASLGDAYAAVDTFFASRAFLDWIGTVTGITDLRYDRANFGGGTHENFHGRDLRPHVDFNIHPVTKLHRRVNLIVYLNDDWEPEWGGALTLYADARTGNPAARYDPAFNRCVIFETSERSWHGFDRINLPESRSDRSRKSLSIYLYTAERPDGEIVAEHTTFYVPRAMPGRYRAGYHLTGDDERDLRDLLEQRDRLIELYQSELSKRESDTVAAARLRIRCAQLESALGIPTLGYACTSDVVGRFPDGWSASELRFSVEAERDVRSITLRLRIPAGLCGAELSIEVDGTMWARTPVNAGYTEVTGVGTIRAGTRASVRVVTGTTVNPKALGVGSDDRDLGFFLERAILEHA